MTEDNNAYSSESSARRRRFLRLAAAMPAATVAGCLGGDSDDGGTDTGSGNNDGGTDSSSDGSSNGEDELVVMGFRELSDDDPEGSGSPGAVYNHQLEQFEEEFEVSVDYRFISIEEFRTQGLSIVGADEAPDVFETLQGPRSAGQFADSGDAREIRDLVDPNVWDTRQEGGWLFEDGDINGIGTGDSVYGVPNQVSGFPLWFSIPVLEDAGIDVERVRHASDVTWSEFEEMCAQIRDAGYMPLSLGNRVGGHIPYLLHCAFTKTFEYSALEGMARDENDMQFTDSAFVDAVSRIKGWWDQGFINEDTLALDEDTAEQRIFTQQAAFMTDGIWISYLYYIVDPDDMGPLGEGWDFMWWPYRPDVLEAGQNQLFGHPNGAWTVSSRVDDRGKNDTVADFLEYWAGLEQEEFRSANGNLLPAHQDADAFYSEPAEVMYSELTDSETTQTTVRVDQLFGADVGEVMLNQGQGLFSGDTTVEELLQAMEEAR